MDKHLKKDISDFEANMNPIILPSNFTTNPQFPFFNKTRYILLRNAEPNKVKTLKFNS